MSKWWGWHGFKTKPDISVFDDLFLINFEKFVLKYLVERAENLEEMWRSIDKEYWRKGELDTAGEYERIFNITVSPGSSMRVVG